MTAWECSWSDKCIRGKLLRLLRLKFGSRQKSNSNGTWAISRVSIRGCPNKHKNHWPCVRWGDAWISTKPGRIVNYPLYSNKYQTGFKLSGAGCVRPARPPISSTQKKPKCKKIALKNRQNRHTHRWSHNMQQTNEWQPHSADTSIKNARRSQTAKILTIDRSLLHSWRGGPVSPGCSETFLESQFQYYNMYYMTAIESRSLRFVLSFCIRLRQSSSRADGAECKDKTSHCDAATLSCMHFSRWRLDHYMSIVMCIHTALYKCSDLDVENEWTNTTLIAEWRVTYARWD